MEAAKMIAVILKIKYRRTATKVIEEIHRKCLKNSGPMEQGMGQGMD
jgi:hypothetical protein